MWRELPRGENYQEKNKEKELGVGNLRVGKNIMAPLFDWQDQF